MVAYWGACRLLQAMKYNYLTAEDQHAWGRAGANGFMPGTLQTYINVPIRFQYPIQARAAAPPDFECAIVF